MKIDRLFQVLVVSGASAVSLGLAGCGDDDPAPGPTGASGAPGSGGSSGDQCNAVCGPSKNVPSGQNWIDCNGCCCWIGPGIMLPSTLSPPCPTTESCCTGRGRS